MPTNKHASIRYQALDKCFRNPGRNYFIDDLIDACGAALREYSGDGSSVSRRQIFDDITYMESSQGWSIELERHKDGRRVYYRYKDLNFSINSQPLNEREEYQLREALLTLSRFKGMPQFEWVDELAVKLEQGLGLANTKQNIIEFEQNQYLKGLEHITPIYEAIQNQRALTITYQSFKSEQPSSLVFHPYYLKQYNNRWFCLGVSDEYTNLTTLALDRIEVIEVSKAKFRVNENWDFEEYFEDIVGVTLNIEAEIQEVVIKVDTKLYPYLITKPLHESQRSSKTEDGGLIKLSVIPNYELESLILSYGPRLEVVKPVELRDKMKKTVAQFQQLYH